MERNGGLLNTQNANPITPTHPGADIVTQASSATSNNSTINRERVTQDNWFVSGIVNFVHHTLVPLYLLLFVPHLIIALWYTAVKCDGSFSKFVSVIYKPSLYESVLDMWSGIDMVSRFSCLLIMAYMIWALVMMRLLPGKYVAGPVTSTGHVPVYKDNGLLYYVVTVATFFVSLPILKSYGYSPSIVYDKFGDLIATLCIFSYLFCLVLYLKGIFLPSTADSGSTGNPIFDYYWGTELYPRIFGFDVKLFTNCRVGMMGWALLVLVYTVKSYELHGFIDSMFVNSALQLMYITKFFMWEAGYMRTIDIMLDRAGFYICWGCLVYVPGLYASVSLYLVNHPVKLGPFLAAAMITGGIFSLAVNYLADAQKMAVREADGNCMVWGRKAEVIHAKYRLDNGEIRGNILLASGWWGLSRHFHYIPEILLAFCWSAPALTENMMPYTYIIWLVVLLVHRTYRDDYKCSVKYGHYWTEYCRRVPYRIIPYLF